MATLSISQIAQYAVNAGIPSGSQKLYVACAICLAESGGRTDAVNVSNSDGSRDDGLWQINSIHNDKLPGQSRHDPNVNARLMYMISNAGTNWQPWTVYQSGAYLTHMGKVMGELQGKSLSPGPSSGNPADNDMGGTGGTVQTVGMIDTAQDIGGFFADLTKAETWMRILKVTMGLLLLITAIVGILVSTEAGKKAIKTGTELIVFKGKKI